MWIKLTMRNSVVGDGKVLINTDNVSCVATGQARNCEGETLVFFVGDKDDRLVVSESVDKVEEIIGNGLRNGERNADD